MKFSMAITLDGLVRALRWNLHDLAETVESGRASEEAGERRTLPKQPREQDDDRADR